MRKLTILFLFFVVACTNIYEVPTVNQLNIMVKYPSEIDEGKVMQGVTVKITDNQTGRHFTTITNELGVATFEVRGSSYDITTSVMEDRMFIINGKETAKTIIFSGIINGHIITSEHNEVVLQTNYSIYSSSFVIKELYVSGSRTPEGEIYRSDAFVEIYNNSDTTLYSDGLCFGTVHPTTTYRPTPWVDNEGNLLPRIPCWGYIAVIPGNGYEHPVTPGESVVLALSGINHRDDPNGNPNSIDLSDADWEMFIKDGKYVDAPSVPNLLMPKISENVHLKTMILDVRGQVSVLFRLPNENTIENFMDPDNYLIQPGGTERCFMVPWEWVIDGVENVRLDDRVYKRLPPEIDLGYIQFRGSYEKVSIRRKVKEVINGRIVYQDTNNSSEDFLTNQDPQPGINSAN